MSDRKKKQIPAAPPTLDLLPRVLPFPPRLSQLTVRVRQLITREVHFRRHATTTTACDGGEFGVVVKNEVQGGGLGRATAAQAGQGEGGGRRPALAAGAGLAVFIRAARAVEDGDVRGGVPADERGLEREGNGERERRAGVRGDAGRLCRVECRGQRPMRVRCALSPSPFSSPLTWDTCRRPPSGGGTKGTPALAPGRGLMRGGSGGGEQERERRAWGGGARNLAAGCPRALPRRPARRRRASP